MFIMALVTVLQGHTDDRISNQYKYEQSTNHIHAILNLFDFYVYIHAVITCHISSKIMPVQQAGGKYQNQLF